MSRHPVMVRQVCPLLPQDPQESPDLLISAEFVWCEEGILELSYNLRPAQRDGDLLALALPSLEPASASMRGDRRDELWWAETWNSIKCNNRHGGHLFCLCVPGARHQETNTDRKC